MSAKKAGAKKASVKKVGAKSSKAKAPQRAQESRARSKPSKGARRTNDVKAWQAAGRAWLEEVPGGVAVVKRRPRPRFPLAHAEPSKKAAERFGRALATTHLAGAPGFGALPPGWLGSAYFGNQPIASPEQDALPQSWSAFHAQYRLLPLLRRAVDAGQVDGRSAQQVEQLCELMAAGAYDDRRPAARIHGELWRGTMSWTRKGVVLAAPSAHGGHAETDLATLRLMGVPHLERIEDAWAEVYQPLGEWRDRAQLHQLHFMLAHAPLFSNPWRRTHFEGQYPHVVGEIAETLVRRAR